MNYFKNRNGRIILLEMVEAVKRNKAYLGDIDGLIGDGDHGMNMNKGFTLYGEALGNRKINFSEGLFELGMILLNKIGGSMGPIYGTFFMEMSNKADQEENIDLPLFANMMQSGVEGLYEIVDARPGDKTLIDTIVPALDSLQLSITKKLPFDVALDVMKAAAEEGKISTKEMVAKYGRAARLGERSRGVMDAGATSCSIILQAMADGIQKVLES